MRYDEMTNEDFDSILEDILDEQSGSSLLMIPGAYEVLAEYFNNEVLDRWETGKDNDHG